MALVVAEIAVSGNGIELDLLDVYHVFTINAIRNNIGRVRSTLSLW